MIKSNILFIQVDQLTALALKAYGNTFCKAPNLDLLAERGVVFESAYCNFPLCAPSRFSMASGQLCSRIGAFDNAAEFPASIPTYAHYLRRLGYRTALSGKMHFIGPDQFHGFETRLTAELYPADFSWVPNWGDEGKRDTNDPRSVTVSGICERSVQIEYDEEVTFKAIRYLYDTARSDDERPFFLQVSYTHPHEPYLCKQAFWDLYEDVEIPLPSVGALPKERHDPHARRLLADFGMLDHAFAEEDIRRSRRAYFGAISYLDRMIGQVLDALAATGAADKTAIVFTSDHGEMLGERGMWFKKHFFEPALRVPLLIAAPWIEPGRVATLASLVDLLPTFVGLAGGDAADAIEPLDGMDLTSLLGDGDSPPNRSVYAEYLAEATVAPIFMIRSGSYKFISSSADPNLLFDLEADPLELENLATKPEHAGLTATFEAEVRAKWDERELTDRILESQRRRRLILGAHKEGAPIRWNHGEAPGDQVPWYRGEGSYNAWAFDYLPRAHPDSPSKTAT